jgi:ATP/maltotriose-dependent transcriptional regulator MalT
VSQDPAGELAGEGDVEDLAGFLYLVGRPLDGRRALDAAIARAGDDVAAVLRLEALASLIVQEPPTRVRARVEGLAARVPPGTAAERLLFALRAQWTGLTGESAAETVRLARLALEGGGVYEEHPTAVTLSHLPFLMLLADEPDAAEAAFAQWWEANRTGGTFTLAAWSAGRAYLALARGNVALAEAGLRAGLSLLREAGTESLALGWLAGIVETLTERGDVDGADAELRRAGFDGELGDGYWATDVRMARGRLRIAQGRFAEGLADLERVRGYAERSGELNPARLPWASAAAPALPAADARAAVGEELERARRWGTAAPIGRALRALGVLEGDLALLERAVDVLAPSPRRLEYLYALYELGAARRRARERVAAREPLRAALSEARRLGALALARRAADELAATGETVRAPLSTGVESLTPSERRIAAVAAEGMSNREIAQALFVSVKTVETHLSAVYRKLAIAGRPELAGALAG